MSECVVVFFFIKQKSAYEMRISDWSSDVCSSDLTPESRIERVVNHAASRGAARFAALVPDSVYGNRITAALRAAVRNLNAQVTRVETYEPALTDRKSVV